MNIVHRVVVTSSILSAAMMWVLLHDMPEISTGQKVLYVLFPGTSVAAACYCVCMVFNCLGRR